MNQKTFGLALEEEFVRWWTNTHSRPEWWRLANADDHELKAVKDTFLTAFRLGHHQGMTRAAEIEKDAERFRFLISQNPEWMIQQKDEIGEHWAVKIGWRVTKRYNSLVELIDAAILTERDKGD